MKRIILASKSPRRQELLAKIIKEFEVCPSNADETLEISLGLDNAIKKLAILKAEDVYKKTESDCIVIGSDTLVIVDDTVMGKPKDQQEAFNMLKMLSGREHLVKTSIAVLGKDLCESDICTTSVKFRELTDDEIKKYIATGEPMDKAGAYGIQDKGAVLVEYIHGDFYSVMGLPVSKLYRLLLKCGIEGLL